MGREEGRGEIGEDSGDQGGRPEDKQFNQAWIFTFAARASKCSGWITTRHLLAIDCMEVQL